MKECAHCYHTRAGITQQMIKDAVGRLDDNLQKPSYKIDDVVRERCNEYEMKGRQVRSLYKHRARCCGPGVLAVVAL